MDIAAPWSFLAKGCGAGFTPELLAFGVTQLASELRENIKDA
jgi:hypothetical protein